MRSKVLMFLAAGLMVLSSFNFALAGPSIDQQYTGGGGTVSINSAWGRFAQTFKPTYTKLDKVELELANITGSPTVAISIRHRSGTTWDEGFMISTAQQVATNGWNIFDFEDQTLAVTDTDSYGIYTSCDDTGTHWKYTDGPSTYSRGYAIWQSTDKPDWDYNFKTWGYEPTPIVDENTQPSDSGNTTTGGSETLAETTSSSIAKPTSLSAEFSQDNNGVKLEWKASTTVGIDGYKVFRSESYGKGYVKIGETKKDVLAYLDEDFAAGKTYYYQVRAYKAGDQSASSNIASATLPADIAPAKPQKLTITDTTEKSLTARWKKSTATNLAGYTINLYKGSEKIRTNELAADVVDYSFLGLDTGVLYKVELIAEDSAGKTSSPAVAYGVTKLPESWVKIASTFNLVASAAIIVLLGILIARTVQTMRKKSI